MSKSSVAVLFWGSGSRGVQVTAATVGVWLTPCTVAEADAVPPRPSETVTEAVNELKLLTTHVAELLVPDAQPVHEYERASPSGSTPLPVSVTEQDTLGLGGWQELGPVMVTVGAWFGAGVGEGVGGGVGEGAGGGAEGSDGVGEGAGPGSGVGVDDGLGDGRPATAAGTSAREVADAFLVSVTVTSMLSSAPEPSLR